MRIYLSGFGPTPADPVLAADPRSAILRHLDEAAALRPFGVTRFVAHQWAGGPDGKAYSGAGALALPPALQRFIFTGELAEHAAARGLTLEWYGGGRPPTDPTDPGSPPRTHCVGALGWRRAEIAMSLLPLAAAEFRVFWLDTVTDVVTLSRIRDVLRDALNDRGLKVGGEPLPATNWQVMPPPVDWQAVRRHRWLMLFDYWRRRYLDLKRPGWARPLEAGEVHVIVRPDALPDDGQLAALRGSGALIGVGSDLARQQPELTRRLLEPPAAGDATEVM